MSTSGRAHRLIVDRVEGDLVVVEVDGGQTLDLPRWLLPPGVGEGAVVRVEVGGDAARWVVELAPDAEAEEALRAEAQARLERLRQRDPGGDIQL